MKAKRKQKQFLIFLSDFFLLVISVYFSLFIRNAELSSFSNYMSHLVEFIPIILFWLIFQYIEGLYSLENSSQSIVFSIKIFFAATSSLFFGFTWFYLLPNGSITPKTILVLYCIISFIIIFLWRYLLTRIILRFSRPTTIGIIGISPAIDELINYSREFSYMRYSIVGIFDENNPETKSYNTIPVYKNFDNFMELILEKNISQIVVINKDGLSAKIHKNLFFLLQNHITFISITKFYETYIRKIPLSAINELWFLQNIDLNNKKIYVPIKRFFDVLVGGFFLLLTLPFYPLILAIIKIESKGPVFFTQIRSGFLGSEFKLYKFRSMTVSGNTYKPTEKKDARITKFGNIMRKTRIDELPQLFNVIKGEMSLIGPRPERPELIIELEQKVPYYKQRLLIKPGISGWDQVSGEYHSPSIEDTFKKLQYDLYYIKNMSFFLDISILARTIRTVLSRSGI